jgi:iron-sulfur cluster assembly protein
MSITLTPSAAQRLRNYLAPRGQGVAMRFGAKKSGCSGFGYVMEVNVRSECGCGESFTV